MIKFSNGNKLFRFYTDGNTAKLQVETPDYTPTDFESKLTDEQISKLKEFIEETLIPQETFKKYSKYIYKKVIYYDAYGKEHIGYLAAVFPKDPEYPFGIYRGADGKACLPEDANDITFTTHIKPLEEDE